MELAVVFNQMIATNISYLILIKGSYVYRFALKLYKFIFYVKWILVYQHIGMFEFKQRNEVINSIHQLQRRSFSLFIKQTILNLKIKPWLFKYHWLTRLFKICRHFKSRLVFLKQNALNLGVDIESKTLKFLSFAIQKLSFERQRKLFIE